MKNTVLIPALCALMLTACQSAGPAPKQAAAPASAGSAIEITGEVSTTMSTEPMVPTRPGVDVYPIDGPVVNPLSVDRTQSVLDNTTAGGYTVFDPSVKVYPLPGEVAPTYMPNYAVPPLVEQVKPVQPMVGTPVGLAASSGMLPPVPTVDVATADPYARPPVAGAVRAPITLTAVEPVTMQPPSSARAPLTSPFPFEDEVAAPVMDAPTMEAPAVSNGLTAGRRSSPLLTGY